MIVVLAILGLVAGLVLARQPWRSSRLDAEASVRAVTDALRLARSRAIAQGRAVVVETGYGGFTVDGGRVAALPPGEVLQPARIIFSPDGGVLGGGMIRLLAAGGRYDIGVNWLTGQVTGVGPAGP